jgi:hypothetical protein
MMPLRRRQRGFIIDPFRGGSGSPPVTDPFFANVVQLAHFQGANGSTTFTNSCPRGTTFVNSGLNGCALSTARSAIGSSSLLTASSQGLAGASTSSDYTIGTSDFVAEFFVYLSTTASAQNILDMRASAFQQEPTIYQNGTTVVYNVGGAGDQITSASSSIAASAWHFMAVARDSGTTALYCGPISNPTAPRLGTFSDSFNYASGAEIWAGGGFGGAAQMNAGNIEQFRLTIGTSRGYTGSSITIPTAPFPDS